MAILLTNTDFVGEYAIPQNQYTKDDLNSFIDRYERSYLYKLLGVELGNLFIADLVAKVPQSAEYLAIYNEFAEDYNYGALISRGMKDMMLRFVYFEYVRTQKYNVSITGVVQTNGTNSTPAKYDSHWITRVYNDGVDTANAIQCYIEDNSTDYSTFKGIEVGYIFGW